MFSSIFRRIDFVINFVHESNYPSRAHRQLGSLAGAAHLSNYNAGVLRLTQREQKSHIDQRGECLLDFDFQCEYEL